MEHDNSLLCSQEPANSPYPELYKFNPQPYIEFLESLFLYYPSISAKVIQEVAFFQSSRA